MSLTRRTDRMYLPEEVATLTAERDDALGYANGRDKALAAIGRVLGISAAPHEFLGVLVAHIEAIAPTLAALRRIEADDLDIMRGADVRAFAGPENAEMCWEVSTTEVGPGLGPTLAEALAAYDRARGVG